MHFLGLGLSDRVPDAKTIWANKGYHSKVNGNLKEKHDFASMVHRKKPRLNAYTTTYSEIQRRKVRYPVACHVCFCRSEITERAVHPNRRHNAHHHKNRVKNPISGARAVNQRFSEPSGCRKRGLQFLDIPLYFDDAEGGALRRSGIGQSARFLFTTIDFGNAFALPLQLNVQEDAMPRVIEEVSTLTDRYQTTLPRGVRQYLQIGKRDQIRYVTESGRVYIEPARANKSDPALVAFLTLLANDFEVNPGRIAAFDTDLHQRIAEIVSGVEIDMDAPLSPDDE